MSCGFVPSGSPVASRPGKNGNIAEGTARKRLTHSEGRNQQMYTGMGQKASFFLYLSPFFGRKVFLLFAAHSLQHVPARLKRGFYNAKKKNLFQITMIKLLRKKNTPNEMEYTFFRMWMKPCERVKIAAGKKERFRPASFTLAIQMFYVFRRVYMATKTTEMHTV